jgi:ATP phosphoribosyltransferase
MQEALFKLLGDAGIAVRLSGRGYRPTLSLPGFEAKMLKPQNIVEMLQVGSRDIGFAGIDWVRELGAQVVELLDTELDPVAVVAAAPIALLEDGRLPKRPLVVASEYEQLTRAWIAREGIAATFVRSYGATEAFPPEDADCIVDNSATGSTLDANKLTMVAELMRSSTRLFAHPAVLDDKRQRDTIDRLILLLRSVLDARRRVMIEVNVSKERLEALVRVLPCMREPTIAPLHGDVGYAVKAAVPREDLPRLIPEIKAHGGTDVVVSALAHIVP